MLISEIFPDLDAEVILGLLAAKKGDAQEVILELAVQD
jgi:CUE domain